MTFRAMIADSVAGLRLLGGAAAIAWGLAAGLAAGRPVAAAELLYYHGKGCSYCEAWDAEVAPIYPATEEGARLPLRRVSADAPLPADLSHIKGLVYTPTFVVLDDSGREVGRIPGYQPEWFWAYLRQFIARLDAADRGGARGGAPGTGRQG